MEICSGRSSSTQAAKKAGVKPIIGCEVYLAPRSKSERREVPGRRNSSHLTLLAANATGYSNLVKLVSRAHLEGFYYKPRIDKDDLAELNDGLICLSGCLNGEVNEFIRQDQLAKARESVGLVPPDVSRALLSRTARPRARGAGEVHPAVARVRARVRSAAGGGQRRAFPRTGRPRGARCADLRGNRSHEARSQPPDVFAGGPFQISRGDAAAVSRGSPGVRCDPRSRRALRTRTRSRPGQHGEISAVWRAGRQPARGILPAHLLGGPRAPLWRTRAD